MFGAGMWSRTTAEVDTNIRTPLQSSIIPRLLAEWNMAMQRSFKETKMKGNSDAKHM
jgi:hypothetical protein